MNYLLPSSEVRVPPPKEVVAVVLVVVVVGDPLPPPPPPPPFTYSRPPPAWTGTAAVPTAALAPLTGLAGGEESVDE
ncbi:hypothetical protein B0H14DRAFT_3493297 [Mycena olivaceomarginata]|nr:hypothetical protein B0H14DRAFT_3493297 [Mycena olivaceomarginata]